MVETMRGAAGMGLAAPQIGISLQLIVIEYNEKLTVLINPEVVKKSKEEILDTEGCLCLPGYSAEVKRAAWVKVKGRDLSNKEVRIKGEGLLARALLHEIDHLNGVLFIDYLESLDQLRPTELEKKKRVEVEL